VEEEIRLVKVSSRVSVSYVDVEVTYPDEPEALPTQTTREPRRPTPKWRKVMQLLAEVRAKK
jgi:hypothetical protein